MNESRDVLTDVRDVAWLGERAIAMAAELREQIARDRATAQALREYLEARGTRVR